MPPIIRFIITREADIRTLLAEVDRQAPEVVHRAVLPQILSVAGHLERHGGGAAAIELGKDDAAVFRTWLESAHRRHYQAGHPMVGDAFARIQQSEH